MLLFWAATFFFLSWTVDLCLNQLKKVNSLTSKSDQQVMSPHIIQVLLSK